MKYIFLTYQDEQPWAALSAAEREARSNDYLANEQDLKERGRLFAVEDVQGSPAITLRVVDGQISLSDGPCPEMQGQVIRLFFIEARDLNEAIQIAAQMPQAQTGPIEIRSILAPG